MASRQMGDFTHVECIVIDPDTLRHGGNEFKRVKTCKNAHTSFIKELRFKCSACGGDYWREGMPFSYCPGCGGRVIE